MALTERERELVITALQLAPTKDSNHGEGLDATEDDLARIVAKLESDAHVAVLESLVRDITTGSDKQVLAMVVSTLETVAGMAQGLSDSVGALTALVAAYEERGDLPESGVVESARDAVATWQTAVPPIRNMIAAARNLE